MNAVVNMQPDEDPGNALSAAVRTARETLASARESVARARGMMDAAQALLKELEATEAAAVAAHSERLHSWIIAGNSGTPPALLADPQHSQDKATASQTFRAASDILPVFEQAEASAKEQLAKAEKAWQGFQNTRLTAEADRIAARVVELRKEESELCARLVALDLDSTHSLKRGLLSAQAAKTLTEPPPRPHLDQYMFEGVVLDRHTPLGGHSTMLDAARKFWREFGA